MNFLKGNAKQLFYQHRYHNGEHDSNIIGAVCRFSKPIFTFFGAGEQIIPKTMEYVIWIIRFFQVMKYGGTTELVVYGVVVTVSSLFQALFNGVSQAIQPFVGVLFLVIGEAVPTAFIKLFIDATADVITAAPKIIRLYFIPFIPIGITVLATYYLQSTLHDKLSMIIAILRSIVLRRNSSLLQTEYFLKCKL